jgi:hypothetical protein
MKTIELRKEGPWDTVLSVACPMWTEQSGLRSGQPGSMPSCWLVFLPGLEEARQSKQAEWATTEEGL